MRNQIDIILTKQNKFMIIKERRVIKIYQMEILSMGMTNDYKIAIQEGANLVRIGSGIFGERENIGGEIK